MQHEVEGCTDYKGDAHVSVAGSEGCASWCSWVPVLAWHYPDGCASCGKNVGQLAGLRKKEPGQHVERPDTVGRDKQPKSHTASTWCKWVPQAALKYVKNCKGVEVKRLPVSAGCKQWCEWVPEPAWQQPEGCRRCSQTEVFP